MTIEDAILACWLVFLAFWAVTALSTKRTLEAQPLASRLTHTIPVFAGVWLLFKGRSDPRPFGDLVLPHTPAVLGLGLALTLAGLSLAIWARLILGRNWSGRVTFKEGHELVRHGPYAHVRHPIYTALLLMITGSAIAIGRLGGLIGLPLVGLGIWLKLRQEEALMSEHFPDEYRSYRSQVGALIPRLFNY
jgi:protein-S-isoprenylcysteine O-methyltransferase Ste14